MSNQSVTGTPRIAIHRVRNGFVLNNVVSMASGQPLYSFRGDGIRYQGNKVKVTTANQIGSEFGETVDLIVDGNLFQAEAAAPGSAHILLDFGLGHFHFTNNVIDGPRDIAIQVTD